MKRITKRVKELEKVTKQLKEKKAEEELQKKFNSMTLEELRTLIDDNVPDEIKCEILDRYGVEYEKD